MTLPNFVVASRVMNTRASIQNLVLDLDANDKYTREIIGNLEAVAADLKKYADALREGAS